MDPDEKALHEHVIAEYQQDVHRLKFDLARANAHNKVKDRIITELRGMIEQPDAAPETPKPGPPPAR